MESIDEVIEEKYCETVDAMDGVKTSSVLELLTQWCQELGGKDIREFNDRFRPEVNISLKEWRSITYYEHWINWCT